MAPSKQKAGKKSLTKAEFWVGLGSSAGGLEALRGLARNLPNLLPVTYIVAQHMAPHHKSLLSEIIGRETSLTVQDAVDNLIPKPNTIYITPPNQNIIVEKNRIRLIDPSQVPGVPKPSVDVFLKSLAQQKKDKAIGIILSGTGSDGSKGIAAINEHGGIAIAQDELTAKYTSMPMMAMETGLVDLVMSPEEIGTQIAKIIAQPRDLDALRDTPINLDGVSELINLLREQTKVNFRHYKTATFQRRVERRMAANNTDVLEDYVTIAKASEDEVQALFRDLLISVTSFFRDPNEFEALRDYINDIVAQKTNDQIRVWVPGTATGEEAYSLAILFSEAIEKIKSKRKLKLQVFATDINQNAIEIARRGFYSNSSLDQVPEELKYKYFDRDATGFTVKKSLREKMVFSYHNIAQDPPFLNMDMISCRNLLIYFQASLQSEVFNRFHYSLVPRGLLFLGKSEAVSASEALFSQAGKDKHIFFQRPSQTRVPPRNLMYEKPSTNLPKLQIEQTIATRDHNDALMKLESLISGLGKCSLLIDDNLNLVKAYGETQDYLGLSAGMVTTKATSLVKEPYRQDIQAMVPGVIRNKRVSKGVTRENASKKPLKEKITVYPVESNAENSVMALAVFEEWESEPTNINLSGDNANDEAMRTQIENLSNELAIVKSNLQQMVEELETSNEELQALNEELQSSNEELQSTNEELETSNEELQSTNEELSTVNEELQVNAAQLNSLNQNLTSILENVTMPLLVVNKELHITNASSVAEEFFQIESTLLMPHLGMCAKRSGFPDLVASVKKALKTGESMQWQITSKVDNATMKVVPYFSASDNLLGAILFVNDNSQELKQANYEFQMIFDNVPAAIMVRDHEGKIIQANNNALNLLEQPEKDVIGTKFHDHFDAQVGKELLEDDKSVVESGKPLLGKTQRVKYKNGKEIWARMSRFPAAHPQSTMPVIYAVTQDITKQHLAAEALQRSEIRLDQAVRASAVGLWDWDIANNTVYRSEQLKSMMKVDDSMLRGDIDDFNTRIHPEDIENVELARKLHFEEKKPYNITYRLLRGDEEYIWVECRGQAVWNDDGVPIRLTGTFRDITQERKSLDMLHEQKEQLELAAKLAGIGYWKVDIVENSIFWSEQVHKIHGTDSKRYIPDLSDGINFYCEDDRGRVEKLVNDGINSGKGFNFIAKINRLDGEVRNVRSIGMPDIDASGKVVALFGVFQDITNEKNRENDLTRTLEELARSNEELNRFSYVCSHDMKEPVRMIESMAGLLVNPQFQADEEKKTALLNRISTNTSRLRGIIDSLLAYSRIDAKIEIKDVDLNIVLDELLDGLALVIEECNAVVNASKMPVMRGSSIHFTQLLHNLIANALKFTDKTEPVVEVSASRQDAGWLLLVEDNGPGIPKEARKEVFNIFNRLQRRDEVEGTGLGLSIVQRIVLQYGGTIRCCDSNLGGIGFEIYIPDGGINDV